MSSSLPATGMARRSFLTAAVAAVAAPALATLAGTALAGAAPVTTNPTPAITTTVEPVHGAGLFDVDPSQTGVSQSPTVVVTSDIAALPLDMAL